MFASLAIAVAVGGVLFAGGHTLFFFTAELWCAATPPVPDRAGCAGVPRDYDASYLVTAVMAAVSAAILIAVSRGWSKSRNSTLIPAIAQVIGTFAVFGLATVWSYSADAVCYPDGEGGCLGVVIPRDERMDFVAVWLAIGVALSAAAVTLGRRAPVPTADQAELDGIRTRR